MMETIREWALVYLILNFILLGAIVWMKEKESHNSDWRTDWSILNYDDIIKTKGPTGQIELYRFVSAEEYIVFVFTKGMIKQSIFKERHSFKILEKA